MKVLVTGGAGYIGVVLCREILEAGHEPVILDRLFWGRAPLAGIDARIICGDIRELEDRWFDGIEAVCHLGGLSNDPTAEYNTAANWQMNTAATEALVRACKKHGIQRFTFASSASLYDRHVPANEVYRSPIMCDERAVVEPRGAYSTSKRRAEELILAQADDAFTPVIFRQGTVYGYSPRMRYDLVVNTFIKDAIVARKLFLHGGGWMWRPLVDVRDVARVHTMALTVPLDTIRAETFNVLEENYQIRQLAMLVTGSLAILKPHWRVEIVEAPLPAVVRNYRMSNAKLSSVFGFTPSVTVLESIEDMLRRLPIEYPQDFGHPRYYNIAWMSLLEEVHADQRSFTSIY